MEGSFTVRDMPVEERPPFDFAQDKRERLARLGPAKALQLKACLEIAQRVVKEDVKGEETRNKSKAVASAQDVFEVVSPLVGNYKKENFFVVSFGNGLV